MTVGLDAPDDEHEGQLTPAQLAALAAMDGGFDPADLDPEDLYLSPPEEWLAMTPEEWLEAAPPPSRTVPEVLDAGFTHRDGGQGLGFAAGGVLDQMEPGGALAMFSDRAWEDGLGKLSDGELVGVMAAARRGASRQAALELATISELSARRAGPDGRPGEHVEEEVAAALTLTGRTAGQQVALADGMARLPGVARALAAGRIDLDKAGVFAGQLALLDVIAANAIAAITLPEAPRMTTGQLRAALEREIHAYDPQALIRRRKQAEKDARVETWTESAGTGAIAGRDLPPADVLAADKTLDADARWLNAHGTEGTMDQLRARCYIARLTGQPLHSLLPQDSPAPGTSAGPGAPNADADAASTDAGTAETSMGVRAPGAADVPAPGRPAAPGWPGGLGGSVNLTMPAAAWLGRSDAPGEISGLGAADAATCREVAAALAAHPAARWCVTLIGRNGRAVAHGCARAGPGPPGTGDSAAWLAQVKITPIETGTCSHRRESAGYQPSDSLRHLIKIRSPRCGFPGCRRPALRCDDDHTIPFHKGGRTCECNLYPLCRRHHQTKQAPGWHLSQPQPGTLIWTTPNGRQLTISPEPYPV